MTKVIQPQVATLGLFEQRFSGDHSLIKLASRVFGAAMIGAELHGGTADHFKWLLSFVPSPETPVTFHLPRDFNITDQTTRARILDLARHFSARVLGLILHDHQDLIARPAEYRDAAERLNAELERIDPCPMLFIEYAAGIPPQEFARFFDSTLEQTRIGACIDVGHVGIRAARAAFDVRHPGQDVCALKSQTQHVAQLMADIDAAVQEGAEAAFHLVGQLSQSNKPIHFHLHDGHPLSTFSPFGVADHLSFFAEIPLNFEYRGARTVATMFGQEGLSRIVGRALKPARSAPVSFTLEIHPTGERLALDQADPLFVHWTDKTHAEKMNHWLQLLSDNHSALSLAIQDCLLGAPASRRRVR
jgi:hypothetical protein